MNRRTFLHLSTVALVAAFAEGMHPQAFHTAVMALALAGLSVPLSVPFEVGAGQLIPAEPPAPTFNVYLPEIHA